ncbi:Type III flagellar switch regulator (C-ring) FliN C-term [Vibrio xiamenensis]|uniref:Type III flagellar switch regulator (C-ring) FliN C-term n=1 Tax=Vibrio xiamenensis TaxID=861298 RepID=A0A1G7ZZ25_9VIBR|nr:FliM/FliN family flagellar motor switch protein [Vibrio xiamenensis]SDH13857.1 Type III flagellar switch regulator (C-ring) FliN C-term [Vibrio xiamenensis]
MRSIAITDIGNPRVKVANEIIDSIQSKNIKIKEIIESHLNKTQAKILVNECESLVDGVFISTLNIDEIGDISFAMNNICLDNVFCEHLNIPTNNSNNERNITESHRNFLNKLGNKLIELFIDDKKITIKKSNELSTNKIVLELCFSFPNNEYQLFIIISENVCHHYAEIFQPHSTFSAPQVMQCLDAVPFDLNAVLMSGELAISALDNVRIGDVIELKKHDLIDVKVGPKSVFKGQLIVAEDNQLGVKYE